MRTMIVLVLMSIGLAYGQASKMTAQECQQILDYPLSMARANQLLTAMDAMTKYIVSKPDFAAALAKQAKMTPAERLAAMENDSKAMAICKQNGLSAKEYLVGVPTLRWALWLATGQNSNPDIIASPANLAFARANLAQLKPRMDAADGAGARK